MSVNLDALQAQVIGLSKADHTRLLERLVVSLDVDARDAELESGRVAPVALDDAMARLRARFPG